METGSRYRTPGSERRLQSNLPATFPKEKLSVDFGTCCQTLPTNPAFFFPLFQTRWLRILLEKWGKRSKRRREERERKKQPQGWRKIVYACALKRKVCGQLLKDFFSSGVKIILRVRGENGRVLHDDASVRQVYGWQQKTLAGQLCFSLLFPLRHS